MDDDFFHMSLLIYLFIHLGHGFTYPVWSQMYPNMALNLWSSYLDFSNAGIIGLYRDTQPMM